MHEEHVVGAVAPAVLIKERVARHRPANADDRRHTVRTRHDRARSTTGDTPDRKGESKMDNERQHERRSGHGDTADERRAGCPTDPITGEPGDADRHGQRTDRAEQAGCDGNSSGREKTQSRSKVEEGSSCRCRGVARRRDTPRLGERSGHGAEANSEDRQREPHPAGPAGPARSGRNGGHAADSGMWSPARYCG